MDVELLDRQEQTVMLAVQGPAAEGYMARAIGAEVAALEKRRCTELPFMQYKLFVSRTGYTGEDGFEIVTSVEAGRAIWRQLRADGVEPCGLGARDTLRLEAALPLWGNDIDEIDEPVRGGPRLGREPRRRAGCRARTSSDARRWRASRQLASTRKLACLRAIDRGVIRDGYPIMRDGERVATVASGSHSPTLGVSIAMAYLPVELASEGTELTVDVRGKPLRAVVVPRPFVRGISTTANSERTEA